MGTRPIASLIYDFDKTLSPNNMQEYGFLRGLKIEPAAFWAECRAFAIENRMQIMRRVKQFEVTYLRQG